MRKSMLFLISFISGALLMIAAPQVNAGTSEISLETILNKVNVVLRGTTYTAIVAESTEKKINKMSKQIKEMESDIEDVCNVMKATADNAYDACQNTGGIGCTYPPTLGLCY